MTPLNHSLVQNTLCFRTLCTQVGTSRLEKLAVRSVFHTDIASGLDKNGIGSLDSEHLLH
jgi:hypothetical protein